MNRMFYIAGWSWIALCGLLVARPAPVVEPPYAGDGIDVFAGSEGLRWFRRAKPHCNAVEASVHLRGDPPPEDVEGTGFGAACLALAGRIEDARAAILALDEPDRAAAAGIVFGVGHPVADSGDDASAGPIMRLVVEFQPWNYMALYHAGISYYGLGEMALARTHLERFLETYSVNDGWRRNALTVLDRLGEAR